MPAVLEQFQSHAPGEDAENRIPDDELEECEPDGGDGFDDGDGDRDDGDNGGGGDDAGDGEDVRWVTVATFWRPTDAQLARIKLESEGIDVVILDENLIATDWLMANAVGGIKVQVPERSLAAARTALGAAAAAATPRESDEPVADGQARCPRCASADIYPTRFSRRISLFALFVSALLLPLAYGRRTRCAACGYEWR